MKKYRDVSPCENCFRVIYPERCENKNCQVWQKWFLGRWEKLRVYPRRLMEQKWEAAGVPLGGNRYAAPCLIRDYLEKDPCDGCVCTPELCRTPCRARQHWAKAREEVRL